MIRSSLCRKRIRAGLQLPTPTAHYVTAAQKQQPLLLATTRRQGIVNKLTRRPFVSTKRPNSNINYSKIRGSFLESQQKDLIRKTNSWLQLGDWKPSQVAVGNAILNEWVQPPNTVKDAKWASKVLRHFIIQQQKSQSSSQDAKERRRRYDIDMSMFHRVLSCWKASGSLEYAEEAMSLLELVERAASASGITDEKLLPDDRTYSMVIHALIKHAQDPATPSKALALLERRLQSASSSPTTHVHDAVWNSCLTVLAKCSPYSDGSAEQAEKVLQRMAHYNNEKISTIALSCVLNTWAKNQLPGAADRAQAILDKILSLEVRTTTKSVVNEHCFNICIDAHAKAGSAQAAQDLLWRMEQSRNPQHQPSSVNYASVIHAWAKSDEPNASRHAEALLERMQNLYYNGSKKVRPNAESYTSVMDALSRSNQKGAAQKAENLLKQMEKLCSEGNVGVCPTEFSYAAVISAWANNSKERNAAERAEAVLMHMENLLKSNQIHLGDTTVAYTAAIHAWSKSPAKNAVQKALALLRRMQYLDENDSRVQVKPNSVTYNTVMAAAAKHGNAELAHDLLQEMQQVFDQEGDADIEPDTVSYSSVIHALANSRQEDAAKRAGALVEKMEQLYANGNEAVRPNTVTYTSAIDCWANSRDPNAGLDAEDVLWHMHKLYMQGETHVKPNTVTLNSTIRVWSYSDEAEAPERAESLLDWMNTEYQNGNEDVKPDRISYNHVLFAWAKSRRNGSVERMEQILRVMQMEAKNNRDVAPNVISYNHVIDAIRNSDDKDKASRCHFILKKLVESDQNGNVLLRPNMRTFHLVLDACARSSDEDDIDLQSKKATMEIALECMSIMRTRKYWVPNSNTYHLFFMACAASGDTKSNLDRVKEEFDACRDANQLNSRVLFALQKAVPKHVLEEWTTIASAPTSAAPRKNAMNRETPSQKEKELAAQAFKFLKSK